MFCNYCGSKNPDDALYCNKCGREIRLAKSALSSSSTLGLQKAVSPSVADSHPTDAAPPSEEVNGHTTAEQGSKASPTTDSVRGNSQAVSRVMARSGSTKTVQIAVIVGFCLVLLFGWLVWPTPYRYDTMGTARIPIRINRMTGELERLGSYGWEKTRRLR